MSNPIKSMLNNSSNISNSTPTNNNLVEQFKRFKSTFSGNPRDMINQMLNSGRFSNAQIAQAKSLAKQLQGLIK